MCAYCFIHEYLLITDEIKNFAQLYLTTMLMIHFVVRYEFIRVHLLQCLFWLYFGQVAVLNVQDLLLYLGQYVFDLILYT